MHMIYVSSLAILRVITAGVVAALAFGGCNYVPSQVLIAQIQGQLYYVTALSGGVSIKSIDDDVGARWLAIPSLSAMLSVHGSGATSHLVIHGRDGRLYLVDLSKAELRAGESSENWSSVALDGNHLVATWSVDSAKARGRLGSLVGFCSLPADVQDFSSALKQMRSEGLTLAEVDTVEGSAINNHASIALFTLSRGDAVFIDSRARRVIDRVSIPHREGGKSCGISPDGETVFFLSCEGSLIVVDLKSDVNSQHFWKWHWCDGPFVAAHFAYDSDNLLVVRSDGKVERIVPGTEKRTELTHFKIDEDEISYGFVFCEMAVSPNSLGISTKKRTIVCRENDLENIIED